MGGECGLAGRAINGLELCTTLIVCSVLTYFAAPNGIIHSFLWYVDTVSFGFPLSSAMI